MASVHLHHITLMKVDRGHRNFSDFNVRSDESFIIFSIPIATDKEYVDKIDFENCSAGPYFKNPYCNPFQSSTLLAIHTFFAFGVSFKYSFTVLRGYFIYLNKFDVHFLYLSLAKIRDAVPLTEWKQFWRILETIFFSIG